jgi:hypothetical protein
LINEEHRIYVFGKWCTNCYSNFLMGHRLLRMPGQRWNTQELYVRL